MWTIAGAGTAAFVVGAPLATITGGLWFLSQLDEGAGRNVGQELGPGVLIPLMFLVPVVTVAAGGAGGYAAFRVARGLQPEPDEDAAP